MRIFYILLLKIYFFYLTVLVCLEKKIVRRHINADYYDEARLRRISKEGKLLYKRRKETVERSFADSKQNYGYRYAQYRGKAKVQSYAWLSCCVQNMKTIALREV